jgi:gamma-glutamylaminecyclotransferase
MKIAVYGTLRRGFGNYGYLLKNQVFLGQETVKLPYKMLSLGGFPGLVPSEESNDIVIEVFNIDEETSRGVDSLEGYPRFYDREEINTSHGKAWIYFLANPESYSSREVVADGDWKNYRNSLTRFHEILS